MPEVLKLKKSNCKNCHKCIRFCPVKAIRFTGHQAHIISDDCILCGSCYVVCPTTPRRSPTPGGRKGLPAGRRTGRRELGPILCSGIRGHRD